MEGKWTAGNGTFRELEKEGRLREGQKEGKLGT